MESLASENTGGPGRVDELHRSRSLAEAQPIRYKTTVPDWTPFQVLPLGQRPRAPRSIRSPEGVGDRLRTIAFAELQARTAFAWAAETWVEAPASLRGAWRRLAEEEDKHLGWLLRRMEELGVAVAGRPVSAELWASLSVCSSPRVFAQRMAGAEERGQFAGERLAEKLAENDPITASLFARIAREETGHVALAQRYLPLLPAS